MGDYLRCKARAGQFSGELAIQGSTADGEEFSLFAPRGSVEYEGSLDGPEDIDAWMRVTVLAEEGGLLLVSLPGESFENGRVITVDRTQVQQRAIRHP
jgi:hypothetical protein